MKRFTMLACLGLAASICGTAAGQIMYVEPPDLGPPANPTPIGSVAAGLNTVRATCFSLWGAGGVGAGDESDSFTFIIPPGLAVSKIEVVASDVDCDGCLIRARSTSPAIDAVEFGANGTYSMLTGAPLPAGLYAAQVQVLQRTPGVPGGGSLIYEFRITAIPADNDSCQFPTTIGLGATAFDTSNATTDGPEHPIECNFVNNPQISSDLWYVYTPAQSGQLSVSTCGSTYDTELAVYSGTCAQLGTTLLACNDDNPDFCGQNSRQSRLAIPAMAGQSYLIRVGGWFISSGPGTLTLALNTTGGCCNPTTGGCLLLPRADCQTFGGTFLGFGATCSPAACVACPSDFDRSGVRNVADIFAFLSSWFAGCP